MNGTVLLFKPNIKRIQLPAIMCQRRTSFRSTYMRFFGSREITGKLETTTAPTVEECLRWNRTHQCLINNQLFDLNPIHKTDSTVDAYDTMIPIDEPYYWLKHTTSQTGNCMLRRAYITSKSPFTSLRYPFNSLISP